MKQKNNINTVHAQADMHGRKAQSKHETVRVGLSVI